MSAYKKPGGLDLLMRVLGLGMDGLVLALIVLIGYLGDLWR